jgi:anti-sigma factor RsiW
MAPDPELSDGLSDDELGDLARLADGTLPADRRAEVEAWVAASPQLARMVERQAAALEALRRTADTGAPARLRAEIDRRHGKGRAARGGRRRVAIRGAIAATAAAALALGLMLPGALQGSPSVADAAALAQKPPSQAAPTGVAGTPQLLHASVDGVPFPNYAAKFGWKPAGARQNDLSGRRATTVYYEKGARRIAYTIVSGDALDPPADARLAARGGVEYRAFHDRGRTVVTWQRGGRTCVLSATAVGRAELIELADWRGKGAIRF